MIAHICEYAKNDWIVSFKLVNCMVYELYLNKYALKIRMSPIAFEEAF